jgi:hypothetical protein
MVCPVSSVTLVMSAWRRNEFYNLQSVLTISENSEGYPNYNNRITAKERVLGPLFYMLSSTRYMVTNRFICDTHISIATSEALSACAACCLNHLRVPDILTDRFFGGAHQKAHKKDGQAKHTYIEHGSPVTFLTWHEKHTKKTELTISKFPTLPLALQALHALHGHHLLWLC